MSLRLIAQDCPSGCDYINPLPFPGSLSLNNGDTLCITTDITAAWTSIAVNNGGVITICSPAYFRVNGSITVNPGGKVILGCQSQLRVWGSYSGGHNTCEMEVYCDTCSDLGHQALNLIAGSKAWDEYCCMTPLPIELLSFYGKNNNGINELFWVTATEINNDYFTLEKSTDVSTWSTVTTVPGTNKLSIMYYSVTDRSVQTTYYRLKQTDYDYKFTYSETIVINLDKRSITELYRINLLGQLVDTSYRGVVFIIYSNGFKQRVFQY